jgi:hypothetical protein
MRTDLEAEQVNYLYEDWETTLKKDYVGYLIQQGTDINRIGIWGWWGTMDTASWSIYDEGGNETTPMRAQIIGDQGDQHLRLLSVHDEALNEKYRYTENLSIAWNADSWGQIQGIVLTENSTISFEAYGERDPQYDGYGAMEFHILAFNGEHKLSRINYYFLHSPDYTWEDPRYTTVSDYEYNFILNDVDGHYIINPLADLKAKYKYFHDVQSIRIYTMAFEIPSVGYLDVDNIRLDNISIKGGVNTPHDYTIKVTGSPGEKFTGEYFYYTTPYPHNGEYATSKRVEGTVPAEYYFRGADVSCYFHDSSQQRTLKIELIKEGNVVCEDGPDIDLLCED